MSILTGEGGFYFAVNSCFGSWHVSLSVSFGCVSFCFCLTAGMSLLLTDLSLCVCLFLSLFDSWNVSLLLTYLSLCVCLFLSLFDSWNVSLLLTYLSLCVCLHFR